MVGMRHRGTTALVIALIFTCGLAAQAPAVRVRVRAAQDVVLTGADLAKLPRQTARVTSHGEEATYEGVVVRDLLTRAGVPAGEALRGKDLAQAVVVTGADGYRVVFGLAEFDPGFTDRTAILADRKNGAPIGADEGPLQLILTGEKRAGRLVRQVVSIEVVSVPR
jgi:hypothetical protein